MSVSIYSIDGSKHFTKRGSMHSRSVFPTEIFQLNKMNQIQQIMKTIKRKFQLCMFNQ